MGSLSFLLLLVLLATVLVLASAPFVPVIAVVVMLSFLLLLASRPLLFVLVLLLLLFALAVRVHPFFALALFAFFMGLLLFDFRFRSVVLALGYGQWLVLFPFLIDFLLDDFEPDLQGLYLCPESEEALVDFSLEMHLYSFLGVIDGLNSTTDLTNLIESKDTFWCFTTASKLSPIRSTSLRCSRSLSTSSKQRDESSICPFYPKIAACLIISSISLSIAIILSSSCLGLSVESEDLPSMVLWFFLVFCSTSCSLLSIQAVYQRKYICTP